MTWFTSDTHFGHRNIIRYCNRPFKNVWEMNHQLIENWNAVVRPDDTVYHLGDFAFLAPKQIKDVIECLNGNIIMIRGNHDGRSDQYPGIVVVEKYTLPGENIFMNHYPEVVANEATSLGFCGHIHTQWRSWQPTPDKVIYNVGTDVWDYHPISLKDIGEDMKNPVNRVVGHWEDAYHD